MSFSLQRRSLLAAAAVSLLSRTAGAAEPAGGASLRAAQYKGGDALLLRAAGIPEPAYRRTFLEFGSGNLIVEAMNGGSVDVGSGSEIPAVLAAASGARIKVVAVQLGDVNSQVVLVPRDSEIRTLADLKGRRVAYVRATTTHYYLARMLESVGLSFADILPLALSPADGAAAFARGSLEAWAIYGYSVPLALDGTGARVLATARGFLSGNYLYYARADALADPRLSAAIGDHLGRVARAYAWQNAHLAAYAAEQAAAIGVPQRTVLGLLENASQPTRIVPITDEAVASAQGVADTFAALGVVPRRVEVAPIFDRRYGDLLGRAPA